MVFSLCKVEDLQLIYHFGIFGDSHCLGSSFVG